MLRSTALSASLLALLFALPAFSASTTANDPLYDIARFVQKAPEPPICCLVPLPSNEPTEEILTFEDWKAKQLQLQVERNDAPHPPPSPSAQEQAAEPSPEDLALSQPLPSEHPAPPRLKVPVVDRFNYANLDCSARVHNSHRSAKSASSILSSKKDRYMLSPCSKPGEEQFVVIELCDDIKIDTVQLANFEFFSGVFKDFSVSVAKTYTSDTQVWTHAGTYRGKNMRGIQTFHPPTSIRDFYRFIRIDIHSHYGNEFYCPVSLLRVFGLTHLEQYKWEEWEAESRSRVDEVAPPQHVTPPESDSRVRDSEEPLKEGDVVVADNFKAQPEPVDELSTMADQPATVDSSTSASSTSGSGSSQVTEQSNLTNNASTTSLPSSEQTVNAASATSVPAVSTESIVTSTGGGSAIVISMASVDNEQPKSEVEPLQSTATPSAVSSALGSYSDASNVSYISLSSSLLSNGSAKASTSTSTSTPPSGSMPIIVPHISHSVPAVTSAGESIFRTIMTRLSALEGNSTLYLKYVEEQSRSLREAIRRLEEDVGRLEGIGKAQSQFFQRTMQEWDKQRKRLEREQGELLSRVNLLADEIVLEKRLGVAQLFLMLVVLVFMFMTRGSRGESLIQAIRSEKHHSLTEWGRRQLSSFSSGEWNTNKRPDRDSAPKAARISSPSKLPAVLERGQEHVKPESKIHARDTFKLANTPSSASRHRTPMTIRSPNIRQIAFHRPRTPTTPRQPDKTGTTPGSSSTTKRPLLRRVSSHNSPGLSVSLSAGSSPSSVRKWAKSAHLHEVRKTPLRSGLSQADDQNSPVPTTPGGLRVVDEQSDDYGKLIKRVMHKKSSKSLSDNFFYPAADDGAPMDHNQDGSTDTLIFGSPAPGSPYREREPFAVLPHSQRNGSTDGPRSLLGSPFQPAYYHQQDPETESESCWIDTDVDSSDVGDKD